VLQLQGRSGARAVLDAAARIDGAVTESWSFSGDLATPWVALACVLAAVSTLLLLLELRQSGLRGGAVAVASSGLVAVAALLLAVMRPVSIEQLGASVGARVLILVDASRSIDLPAESLDTSRRVVAGQVLERVRKHYRGMRLRELTFGAGEPRPYEGSSEVFDARPETSSDLLAALEAIAAGTEELPQAIVVVSDGRLDRPAADRVDVALQATRELTPPLHTVALARWEPPDAAIVAARMAGTVVAHQAAALTVEVACTGGLGCSDIAITARELHLEAPPVVRASGTARLSEGHATVELEVTLDRAGQRILELSIDAPDGDSIPANNTRYLTVDVARDRVRLLHVAGRPTYDVRALRTWLKSDASVDVVAFFILRTHDDNVLASQDELALIPFPVDELFTVHLASFDAVVLQDFDAMPYGLSKHLPRLGRYVKQGGGLIMVGGPNAFVMGNYAKTELATVLPVALDGIDHERAVDYAAFVPRRTRAGEHAPVLEPLSALLGGSLPDMPGTNVVGDAREDATVLWEHPSLKTPKGQPMPVLALGEYGSGRSIALTIDGSHKLLFSRFAASAAGRAHGAFWDALLGWLMRDPRFEPAKVVLPTGCIAGVDTELELRAAFVEPGTKASLEVARMGSGAVVKQVEVTLPGGGEPVTVPVGKLEAGGYTAGVRLARQGRAAPSRYDFACEMGGTEWADPRPDPERLAAMSKVSGGVAVLADGIDDLPKPDPSELVAERRVHAILPPWLWSLIAAASLGGHWILRRRAGLR
jgi:uncharacterized membrane protein